MLEAVPTKSVYFSDILNVVITKSLVRMHRNSYNPEKEEYMKFTKFDILNIEQINKSDDTFLLSSDHDLAELDDSVKEFGILQPIWVQEIHSNSYRIVNGFKRVCAAQSLGIKTVPALVIKKEENDLALFDLYLKERCISGNLNPIEISHIIYKLSHLFDMLPQDIINTYFNLMGLGKNKKVYEYYLPLRTLEINIQKAIIQDELSLEMAALLNKATQEDRKEYFLLIESLRLSKSNQRELWHLLRDVMRRENQSLKELLHNANLRKVMKNVKLTPSQKLERIKDLITSWRYPEYTSSVRRFNKILQMKKLPQNLTIRPAPYFADATFYINFSFRRIDDYQSIVNTLKDLQQTGVIEKLVNII